MTARRRNLRPTKAGWSFIASVMAHVSLLSIVGVVAYHFSQDRERREASVRTVAAGGASAIDLPKFDEGSLLTDHEVVVEGIEPVAHGGATIARVDTQTLGAGGTDASEHATNLAAQAENLRLVPDLTSHLDRDQEQRLRTAALRTTHEDRRATTHPMELTFLATGTGEHPERRPKSASDPSRGSLLAPRPASVPGGHAGVAEAEEADGPGQTQGAARSGQLLASPGVGVRGGAPGDRHQEAARIAQGRPSVAEGPPTVTAAFRGRPNDTVDSDQEVASLVQSSVHASFAGGAAVGQGIGGSSAPAADPGAGGSAGRGSTGHVLGAGDGDVFDFFTNDPALLPYFRMVHARIDPLWADAFPKSAMLELKQGTVIIEFAIAADGTVKVTWPPLRPSGVDEFDKNCADAIRRAGRLPPIPASLREQGHTTLRIRAPFVAKNPIVK